MSMRRSLAITALIMCSALVASCSGGGGSRPVPAERATNAGQPSGFAVPASISVAVPPSPPSFTPARPSSTRRMSVSPSATHPAFFAGEVALSNGVYYLNMPNGNPFGYYSYLSDPHYIYHFDAGYEYVVDASDAQGGVYFYDFASSHWWYTNRQWPFPYLYDFSLGALLYYYPASAAGHSTSNPRYFYDFKDSQIMTMPIAGPASVTVSSATPTDLYITNTYQVGATLLPDGDTPSGGNGPIGTSVDGIRCDPHAALGSIHIHMHVTLIKDGVTIAVPEAIGVANPGPEAGGSIDNGDCFYWIHTHDRTGIIHQESVQGGASPPYLMRQLLHVWGMTITRDPSSLQGSIAGFADPTKNLRGRIRIFTSDATGGGGSPYVTGTNLVEVPATTDPATLALNAHQEITIEISTATPDTWAPVPRYKWLGSL